MEEDLAYLVFKGMHDMAQTVTSILSGQFISLRNNFKQFTMVCGCAIKTLIALESRIK
jgi:hypothetical protein